MTQKERMAHLTRFMQDHPSDGPAREAGSAAQAGPLKRLTDQDYAELAGLRQRVEELELRGERVQVVSLRLIDDSPYQTSPLSEKRVQQLEDNLRENPWGQPILVRPKDGGRFETIAGHHRRAAMARIGKTEIEANVKDFTDDEAQRLVLYDNLLSPDLAPYERYLGLASRAQKANLSQAGLARESGLSKGYISKLMSGFEGLPKAAHVLLRLKPEGLSSAQGEELCRLVELHEAVVVEAVKLLVNGELDGAQAVRWAKEKALNKKSERVAAVRTVVKAGGRNFAEVTRTAGQLRVRLIKAEERSEELEKKIVEILKKMSEK
jgi:ParB family chromosome partitioning protein